MMKPKTLLNKLNPPIGSLSCNSPLFSTFGFRSVLDKPKPNRKRVNACYSVPELDLKKNYHFSKKRRMRMF